MTTKTMTIIAVLLMTIIGMTLTVSAAPGGNRGQQTPQVSFQADFQQALAERLDTSVEVIQEVMDEAYVQAQQSLVRPMNVSQFMIPLLAERLGMVLADVEVAFNEVHLAVTGSLPGAQSPVFNTSGPGNSGRNATNSSMSARGRNSANNNTCSSRSSGRSGRASGNRGNRQNTPSNNAVNNSAQQAIYQSAVLHYAAINLGVDYDMFHAAYLEAYEAALDYANTATVRPINMQTKLFEHLAAALDKTILEVEEAFNDAKTTVFGS